MTKTATDYLNRPRLSSPYSSGEGRVLGLTRRTKERACRWYVVDGCWVDDERDHFLDAQGLWTSWSGGWALCEGLSAQDLGPLYEAILTQQ